MSLRTRLAVALAALAALSVIVVSALNYAATQRRLYEAVDAGLESYAAALTGSLGAIEGYCPADSADQGVLGSADLRRRAGMPDVVQCRYADGEVWSLLGPPGLQLHGMNGPPDVHPADDDPLGPQTQTIGGVNYRVMVIPRAGRELLLARSLTETEDVLAEVRSTSAGVGLAIILLAALAGTLMARWTVDPVARLTAAAEQIAATGRPGPAPPTDRRDEIGRLARAFEAMLEALTESREQQQRLVQDAGHELRTPLTSLRANVDTLRRHAELDRDLRARILGDLDSELKELSTLVDEVVALAIDRHDGEEERPVDLAALAERMAERTRRRTGREVLVRSVQVTVSARPEQVLRAVGNLLDNAVKFSPSDAPIEVTLTPDRVEVRDHGPGIDPADLPRVFDRFYRANAARSVPGSGLGLAIVRQIVQDWGGTVHAANHPEGGVVVTIELPSRTRTASTES